MYIRKAFRTEIEAGNQEKNMPLLEKKNQETIFPDNWKKTV